ncbi:MAG: hypothetical protein WCK37_01925 [Candidatus Falkowbacteria bacterium]
MKKIISGLTLILLLSFFIGIAPVSAATTAGTAKTVKTVVKAKKVVKKKTVKKVVKKVAKKTTSSSSAKTSLKWDASALKIINRFSSFDYSATIRNAYIKKVEAYAKSHGITVISAAEINAMHI